MLMRSKWPKLHVLFKLNCFYLQIMVFITNVPRLMISHIEIRCTETQLKFIYNFLCWSALPAAVGNWYLLQGYLRWIIMQANTAWHLWEKLIRCDGDGDGGGGGDGGGDGGGGGDGDGGGGGDGWAGRASDSRKCKTVITWETHSGTQFTELIRRCHRCRLVSPPAQVQHILVNLAAAVEAREQWQELFVCILYFRSFPASCLRSSLVTTDNCFMVWS